MIGTTKKTISARRVVDPDSIATDIKIGFLSRPEERGPRFGNWAATSHHVEEDLASSKKLFSGICGPRGIQDL
ncbi:hypothetical protein J2X76_005512 [Neorhizobium sp. 2083]|nr:hypothetical protein [Neorhizobium sp. 2083]MDR6820315.1 hypothetical protein [Neorhizobium sp. 2083]